MESVWNRGMNESGYLCSEDDTGDGSQVRYLTMLVPPWLPGQSKIMCCYNKFVLNRLGMYRTTTSKIWLRFKLDACPCKGVSGLCTFFLVSHDCSSVLRNRSCQDDATDLKATSPQGLRHFATTIVSEIGDKNT